MYINIICEYKDIKLCCIFTIFLKLSLPLKRTLNRIKQTFWKKEDIKTSFKIQKSIWIDLNEIEKKLFTSYEFCISTYLLLNYQCQET